MTTIATQNAVGHRPDSANARRVSASPRLRVSSRRPGFTLVEMLIVMGIIVLAITMAVPAIRALTGSKSQSVAQNTISAFLARTRAEAIGLQQVQGVLFYIDPATQRVTLVQVYDSADSNGVAYLDLVADRDQLALPPGLRLFTVLDAPPAGISDLFQTSASPLFRYMGFNDVVSNSAASYLSNSTSLGGVILFDGNGRTVAIPYGFRFVDSTGAATAMGTLAFPGATPSANWPNTPNKYFRSQIAFVLADQQAYDNYHDTASGQTTSEANKSNTQNAMDNYLDANTTPILVNHYNGTLTAAE